MAAGFCVTSLQRILSNADLDRDEVLVQLELVYREVVACQLYRELDAHQELSLQHLIQAIQLVTEETDNSATRKYQAPAVHSERRGRPRFDIPRHQISSMLEMRFTVPSIADILGVSVRTVRRRMTDFNLSIRAMYSELTDEQLDVIVEEIQRQFPTCGNKQMLGHLHSRRIRVQQHRVRESQRRVDPAGSVMRRLTTINRRRYRVSEPGALWHIDGHHRYLIK